MLLKTLDDLFNKNGKNSKPLKIQRIYVYRIYLRGKVLYLNIDTGGSTYLRMEEYNHTQKNIEREKHLDIKKRNWKK